MLNSNVSCALLHVIKEKEKKVDSQLITLICMYMLGFGANVRCGVNLSYIHTVELCTYSIMKLG